MNDLTVWQYGPSVERLKSLYQQVREHGAKAIEELRHAHEALTADSKRKQDRQWPTKTFSTYCGDAGISTRTGYRWLAAYFPDYYESAVRIVPSVTIPVCGYPAELIEPMADLERLFARILRALAMDDVAAVVAIDQAINATAETMRPIADQILAETDVRRVAGLLHVFERLANLVMEKQVRLEASLGESLIALNSPEPTTPQDLLCTT